MGCTWLLYASVAFVLISYEGKHGSYCHRKTVEYVKKKTCVPNTWCWQMHDVKQAKYSTQYYCCPGWHGSGCKTPVCRPPCKNGGRCTSPYHCTCPDGMTGSSCNTRSPCSYLKPCFPGHCVSGCRCIHGYGGETCLSLQNSEKPLITRFSLFLYNGEREDRYDSYRFEAGNGIQVFWMPKIFETTSYTISTYFEALYSPEDLPYKPLYIKAYGIGIVAASVRFILQKPAESGTEKVTPPPGIVRGVFCPRKVSEKSPEQDILTCNLTGLEWNLEHGDSLRINVLVTNGGYRDIINTNTHRNYTTETYHGQTTTESMQFRFDYHMPYHCEETRSCSSAESALYVSRDITKVSPITLSCNGWRDALSGVSFYVHQIFRLIPNVSGDLTEENPLSPLINHISNASTIACVPFSFTPPSPGMYSVLLGVADKANNTKYARRLFLFDNTSSVTVNDQEKLYVSSAVPETGHSWQNNLQTEHGTGNPIQVTWKGHFVNRLHETGHFLNKVQPFKPELLMNIRTKYVNNTLDDHEGKRSVNPITNIHGIVRFEIAHKRDKNGGKTITSQPTSGWTNVSNILLEKQDLNISRSDGDSIRLWVKAYDVMGNINVTSTLVNIDSSPPIINSKDIQKNLNGTYPFTSRINLQILDRHSGIHAVDWDLMLNDANETLLHGGTIHGNRSKADILSPKSGYCTPVQECFYYSHQIEINNCWFTGIKDQLDTPVTDINIYVYNMAMLMTSTKLQVADLTSLDGLDNYAGPMNIRATHRRSNRVRFRWDVSPSCYVHSALTITYNVSSGTRTRFINKDASYYDLKGLHPDTRYSVQFVTHYGSRSSDPVRVSFRTRTYAM